MGANIVVVVFPLLGSFSKEIGVVDDFAFQEPIKFLGIDPVRPLDFPVQTRRARPGFDVADAVLVELPMEVLPKLLPVTGLDLFDLGRAALGRPRC